MKQVLQIIGGVNLGGFLVSYVTRSEVITDLLGTGSIGIGAYLLHSSFTTSPITNAIMLWSGRLALFLAYRAFTVGDHRLRAMLPRKGKGLDFPRLKKLVVFWTLQAVWGATMLLPLGSFDQSANGTEQYTYDTMSTTFKLGMAFSVVGFLVECYADFRKFYAKRQGVDFVQFPLVQYPAYSGEITFWLGIGMMLFEKAGAISFLPVSFVSLLLVAVSGIPLSEKSRNKRFSSNVDIERYRRNTKWLIPFIY